MDMFTVALGRTTFGSINEIDIGFATKQSLIGATIGFFMRDWYLSYVEVLDCATNEKKLFVVDQWINKDQRRVRVKAWALGDQNIYRLLVRTADTKGAGTDAKVMMRMYGKKDGKTVDSGAHKLESSDQRTFERAATDKFFIQCPDLCDLSRIVIATDNGGLFPAWHLAEIEVRRGAVPPAAVGSPLAAGWHLHCSNAPALADISICLATQINRQKNSRCTATATTHLRLNRAT